MANKYGAKKAIAEGDKGELIQFDSQAERDYYLHLKLREQNGEIHSLELQPKFLLQPAFTRNGIKHLPIHYIADFRFVEDGNTIICDVKGVLTHEYKIKKKLFLAQNHVIFREIRRNGRSWEVTQL